MDWKPPPRPEWVENLIAHGDAVGGSAGLLPLDPDALIARARASTGLDDFGPDEHWRPHFEIYLEALEREAALHLAGRIVSGMEILRTLRNRLLLTELWKRRPEILETPVEAPVFVVGSARSGTSITHELFDRDSANRTPLLWEMLHPAEAGEGADLSAVGDRSMLFWHQLQPEYETMHANSGFLPNECIYIFMHSFLSDQFAGCHVVPSYSRHLHGVDKRMVYEEHRRILQTLEPGPDSARWILKAPSHLSQLRSLFAVYPDARIVLTHRDPLQFLGSNLNLLGTLKWMRSNEVDLARWIEILPKGQAALWRDVIDARACGELPDDQFVDVRYADLMADPAATLAAVYEALGWDCSSEVRNAMASYIRHKPRGSRGRHSYSLEQFGLDRDAERERFSFYTERFQIPTEAADEAGA